LATFSNRPAAWGEVDDDTAWAAGMKAYHALLAAKDLTAAGDLLAYFGYDFFHDSGIELTLDDREASVRLKMTAYVDVHDDGKRSEVEVPFVVELLAVDWLSVEHERPNMGLQSFGYAEIDGLPDRIAAANTAHGGEYHSLVIQCSAGWASFVFQSARVAAVDPVLWLSTMRNPNARLAIFGLE
jgi:hypothetical protein